MTFAAIVLAASASVGSQDPIPVRLVQANGQWSLQRAGQPYFIRGAGGDRSLQALKSLGGNSVRTWGVEGAEKTLDAAQRLGLTVTVGIWLGHARHGFRYDDPKMVAEQFERVKRDVARLKNHPALLAWGLGNEMEHENDNDRLWRAVGEIAAMVKKSDPHHPTMTVVSEVSREKIERIRRLASAIDILGVNSYGGLRSLPARLKEFGWTKPFVVTEFGPLGPWESPKTTWGAPIEWTSTEKARFYLESYRQGVAQAKGACLGSYAFLWGSKQETTPTWFGMYLETGESLESVDAMSYAWTGRWPALRAPGIQAFEFSAARQEVAPGSALSASVRATDPNEGDRLAYRWAVRREVEERKFAGDGEKAPESVEGLLAQERGSSVRFAAPKQPGAYRLYLWVRDGTGRAATANEPFFVR